MSREPDESLKYPQNVRPRRSKEQIVGLLEDYQNSGLTQAAFAERRNVPLSTLTSWLRRMRANVDSAVGESERPSFVEARILATERAGAEIPNHDFELMLSNHEGGRAAAVSSVRFRQGFSSQDLRRILRLLGVLEKQA